MTSTGVTLEPIRRVMTGANAMSPSSSVAPDNTLPRMPTRVVAIVQRAPQPLGMYPTAARNQYDHTTLDTSATMLELRRVSVEDDRSETIGPSSHGASHAAARPKPELPSYLHLLHDYNSGILDCFDDVHSCAESSMCLCCMLAREYNMLQAREADVDCMCCSTMLIFSAFICIPGAATGLGMVYVRSLARDRLDLRDASACTDVFAGCLCQPCSASQVYREMSMRRVWPGAYFRDEPYQPKADLLHADMPSSLRTPHPPSMSQPLDASQLQLSGFVVNPLAVGPRQDP